VLLIIGFICWALGAFIWADANSAIHQILAAILVLNGTVLVAANQVTSYMSSLVTEVKELKSICTTNGGGKKPELLFKD